MRKCDPHTESLIAKIRQRPGHQRPAFARLSPKPGDQLFRFVAGDWAATARAVSANGFEIAVEHRQGAGVYRARARVGKRAHEIRDTGLRLGPRHAIAACVRLVRGKKQHLRDRDVASVADAKSPVRRAEPTRDPSNQPARFFRSERTA